MAFRLNMIPPHVDALARAMFIAEREAISKKGYDVDLREWDETDEITRIPFIGRADKHLREVTANL